MRSHETSKVSEPSVGESKHPALFLVRGLLPLNNGFVSVPGLGESKHPVLCLVRGLLPLNYDFVSVPCVGESKHPTLCLVCGQLVCSHSHCCETVIGRTTSQLFIINNKFLPYRYCTYQINQKTFCKSFLQVLQISKLVRKVKNIVRRIT